MLTPEERNLLIQVYDVLVELYTLRQEANLQGNLERANALQLEIDRVEAQRAEIRCWDTVGTA